VLIGSADLLRISTWDCLTEQMGGKRPVPAAFEAYWIDRVAWADCSFGETIVVGYGAIHRVVDVWNLATDTEDSRTWAVPIAALVE